MGAIKVAIVGGGCAGITAAFELTRPEHDGKYAVTVYQLGWRLGGKGASGRGAADRIEEHGLHLWMGFYENAFRLMRECYGEARRDPKTCPIADWRDAFRPDNFVGVMDHAPDGRWLPWLSPFPPLPGLPGDPGAPPRWTVMDYLSRSVTLLRTLFEAVQRRTGVISNGGSPAPGPAGPAAASPAEVTDTMTRLMRYGGLATLTALLESIRILDTVVRALPNYPGDIILQFHDAITTAARRQLEALIHNDDETRRLWEVAELVMATIRGIVKFRLVTDPRGFEAIDNYDCREWLRLNGASERALGSGFLRALYDLAFAYEGGDPARPRIAAGQALRGAVRAFFTYRGALYWRMRAGMGDVIFAPFYEVLRRRGVKFEFFHRLTNVRLSSGTDLAPGESPYVEALEFDVQAGVRGGAPYEPLVRVNGRPCWSARPDFTQLEDGERMALEARDFESHWDRRRVGTKTLDVVQDFDFVVLGVSLGEIPHVCREIVARDPRWGRMVAEVKTVPTQAFQIWLNRDLEDLGWSGPHLGSALTKPFNAWCDMAHTIPEEGWSEPPRTVLYFCAALAEPPAPLSEDDITYVERCRERVRANALGYLGETARLLWPGAYDAEGDFRWEMLSDGAADDPHAPPKRAGTEAFATQYWRANVNPSDRYVLAVPGSAKYRISPLDMTYDNLTIAGDWTACGLNQGCVEAAVMSGRLAAHALAGVPLLEEIVGYDHP